LFSNFNGFWRENNVTELTAKFKFQVIQNNETILKERDVIETNVKNFLEKLNCFRRYSILKCTYNYVSKNSNKMAGNSRIKA